MKRFMTILFAVLLIGMLSGDAFASKMFSWGQDKANNEYVATTGLLAGTAAVDSLTAFTISGGDIYITGLSMFLNTAPGANTELANFLIETGGSAGDTAKVRLGLAKDLNGVAIGTTQYLNPLTAILTDSLAYYGSEAAGISPIAEVVKWRIRVRESTVIRLLLPGDQLTAMTAILHWSKVDPTSSAIVTAE